MILGVSFKTQEYASYKSISKVTNQALWEAHGILRWWWNMVS